MIETLIDRSPVIITYPDIEGPRLTDEMVHAAEETLGVTLPTAYLEELREANGGYLTEPAAFPMSVPTRWADDHVPFMSLNGIPAVGDAGPFGTGGGILATPYLTTEWGLPARLVLLCGEGHWWIALDYRAAGPHGEPSVVWIDVDGDEDIQIAENFATFRAGLVSEDEFEEDDEFEDD